MVVKEIEQQQPQKFTETPLAEETKKVRAPREYRPIVPHLVGEIKKETTQLNEKERATACAVAKLVLGFPLIETKPLIEALAKETVSTNGANIKAVRATIMDA